jgi:hypothetical protein
LIPPGGQGAIILSLDTSSYSGLVRQRALVQTNDPNYSRFYIYLQISVKEVLEATPYKGFYVFAKRGEVTEEKISLKNALKSPVLVADLEHNLEGIAQINLVTVRLGMQYELHLSIKAKELLKRSGFIRLKLKDSPRDEYIIPVYIEID